MIASCSALCVWTDEIRSIAVHLKDRVTSAVDNFCIEVASSVAEEVDGGIVCGLDIGASSNIINSFKGIRDQKNPRFWLYEESTSNFFT